MMLYMSAAGRLPIISSLQICSQLRTSFISALSVTTNFPTNSGELRHKFSEKGVQLGRCHQTAVTLIDGSERFLQEYERICREMSGMIGPSNPVKGWTGDCQKLRNVFVTQESRTNEQINGLLFKHSLPAGNIMTGEVHGSTSQDIWTLFADEEGDGAKKSIEGGNGMTWNEVAERADSDIRRLMRHVEKS